NSFDHLVGAQQQLDRDFMSDCLRGLDIDDQLKPVGLLHRQVLLESAIAAIWRAPGVASIKMSCRLPSSSGDSKLMPVMLPPGRASEKPALGRWRCRSPGTPGAFFHSLCIGGDRTRLQATRWSVGHDAPAQTALWQVPPPPPPPPGRGATPTHTQTTHSAIPHAR